MAHEKIEGFEAMAAFLETHIEKARAAGRSVVPFGERFSAAAAHRPCCVLGTLPNESDTIGEYGFPIDLGLGYFGTHEQRDSIVGGFDGLADCNGSEPKFYALGQQWRARLGFGAVT